MTLYLHDTLARAKRPFSPAEPDRITLYVCGPTVYNRAHIGNARPAVVFDVLARLLGHIYPDHRLDYARNVTDVDDKINAAAAAEGVDISVITRRFEDFYLADMGELGVREPSIAPRATAHVGQMIAMIERLVASGHAYAAEGHVLFHVPADPAYGALARRTQEAMQAGARVEIAPYKKDPADFVLWKPSTPELPGWDSPWGRGRPGWHIECSAMIAAHLGETIDIHGGGQDLIFPHHENEIAQSRCAHGGAPLARFWLHNGFLSMDREKMSKSLGNVVTVADLLAQGHRGETLRLALLSAHYRQPLDWSDALMTQSKARLDRWYRALGRLEETGADLGDTPADDGVVAALADDLNIPEALSRIGKLLDDAFDAPDGGAAPAGLKAARLMGFLSRGAGDWFGAADGDADAIDALVTARADARKRKDFAESDRIRDELAARGVVLEDGPGGTSWRRA
jgi:cysteinyl-tRNA synthetase